MNRDDEGLRAAFRLYDQDGDGRVSLDELRRILHARGEELTEPELEEMVREVDSDGDGYVSFEEFVASMRRA